MAALEGKTLDRYELRRLIGRGGMANVYEGYDTHFQRIVAVKVFKRDDEEMLRRFIREAHVMASLKHEHLVPIYDSGETSIDGLPWYYIVMPFLEGGTLRARIRRSPLPLAEVCRCLRDIASALDYIHAHGIIHRDIKSSNVLLDNDGRCYLTDFGVARITSDATQVTSTGNVLGTVDYIAPELFEINTRASIRSDLYSLGVLLFEMVTGQLPFASENQIALISMHIKARPPSPRSIVGDIAPQVERVMLKAMEKNPENRYGSATELTEAFCFAVASSNAISSNGLQEQDDSAAERRQTRFRGRPMLVPLDAGIHQEYLDEEEPVSLFAQARPSPGPPQAESLQAAPSFAFQTQVASQPPSRQAGSPPPSPELRRRRSWLIALLALILLLIVTVPLTYLLVFQRNSLTRPITTSTAQSGNTATAGKQTTVPTPTPNLTATAQAALAATATAQTQATATAIAGATATAQAQASATAGVIQTATSGNPAYSDALNNPNNPNTSAAGWDQNDSCVFSSDGYHDKASAGFINNLHGCHESNKSYSNVAITVDVRLLSGHSGGLFFRLSTGLFNTYSGYLFEIDSAGYYRISNFQNNAMPLQDWEAFSGIKKGNLVTNTLQVIARGSNLSFYANGVFLVQLTDSTYTSGEIGFLATATDSDADVVYSDLNVYPLS